jgi:hypothetical protein
LPEESLLEPGIKKVDGEAFFELLQPDKNQTAASVVTVASSPKLAGM